MQPNFDLLNKVTYLIGSAELTVQLPDVTAKQPFYESILKLLNDV